MGIPVTCSSCSSEFNASSKVAGKRIKCPVCGEGLRVPQEENDEPVLSSRSSGGQSSGKRRARKSEGQSSMLMGLGIGGGGVAVLGVILFMMSKGGGNAQIPVIAPTPAPAMIVQQPTPVVTQPNMSSPQNITPSANSMALAHSQPAQQTPSTPSSPSRPGSVPKVPSTNSNVANDEPQKAMATSSKSNENEPLQELEMTDLVELMEKSVVRILVRGAEASSVGSGFVIDSDGSIMTNYHVIEGAKSAVVEFQTGKKSNVIGFTTIDQERDLAIIKIKMDESVLHKVRIAGDLPRKGEKVAAFGAPRNLSFTASDGIISAIRHTPDFKVRTEGSYLQTTAPISPGNSGGPLVNMKGEVVGVNSFKIEGENLNFAVSSTDIADVIEKRGDKVTPLSPEALPAKYSDKFAKAENLAGTTKGNILLGNINDAIIRVLPFTFDPTRRVSDFVEAQVEKNLIKKAGWAKVTRQAQVKGSTALVVVLIYFQVAENIEDADMKRVSELMCRTRIIVRDVDKDGEAYQAIVWDENGALGTIAIQALVNGTVPEAMKTKVSEFFSKIVSAYRKAKRAAESGK